VLASSEIHPQPEEGQALETAGSLGLPVTKIETNELENEAFAANPPHRCYICKKELFGRLIAIAGERGIRWVADGANVDDLEDFRPGNRAAVELGVRSPLREAGFTKGDIREAAKRMGLPTWDKPSLACLASRIPYGTRIEPAILRRLDEAELFLTKLGFRQVRVRHHGDVARIEVEPEEISRLAEPEIRQRVADRFKELQYPYVTLDLSGYRMGSMNAVLNKEKTE
jgi:uncharacterized protein